MKKLLSLLMLAVLVIGMVPTFAAPGDLVDVADTNGSFVFLVAALEEAELVSALQANGPFTVFAPTDAAFATLVNSLGISGTDLLRHPQLADVLLHHVVAGEVMSTDLSDGLVAETLQGESVTFDLSDGVMVENSTVVMADVDATNGVIHVVDQVLIPDSFDISLLPEDTMMMDKPDTVVDIALGNEDFSILVAALQRADLVAALQGNGPFTVFAPTDAAFVQLAADLNITPAELLAQPDLADVLLYHVVSGKVMSTDLSDGMSATTLEGGALMIDLDSGVMINTSSVLAADVEAENGVVHVIDRVLVPDSFVLAAVDMTESLPATGDMGMVPFMVLGLAGIGGLTLSKKRES